MRSADWDCSYRSGIALLGALGIFALSACGTSGDEDEQTPSGDAATDPASLAADAFVWGFPLVVTQRYLQTFSNLLGVNTLFNQTALSTAGIRLVVAPNQDTLYSVAVLDVRNEPVVLTVPDILDRYWTYQFLDGWTNSFHYVGTRATSGKGGSFAVTAPGWSAALPSGVEKIESPTPVLFLLGRFLVKDGADVANVTSIPRTLVPLSVLTGETAAPAPPALGEPPGTPAETGSTGAVFFDELGDALAVNGPATAEDKAAVQRFQSLGIGPGLHPTTTNDAALRAALDSGVTTGLERIGTAVDRAAEKNGWRTFLDVGIYTDDFPLRAAVSKFAWAANVPEEAVYSLSTNDAAGQPYDGNRPYQIHFGASELPPVDSAQGFWSITLYGSDMFFVENSIQRYAIGDRTPGLTYNADGSLDVYIQNTSPTGYEGNWLPAPLAPFLLVLRLYLPSSAVREGSYVIPPVVARL